MRSTTKDLHGGVAFRMISTGFSVCLTADDSCFVLDPRPLQLERYVARELCLQLSQQTVATAVNSARRIRPQVCSKRRRPLKNQPLLQKFRTNGALFTKIQVHQEIVTKSIRVEEENRTMALNVAMITAKIKCCQILLDKNRGKNPTNHIYERLFETQLNLIIRGSFINKFWSHFTEDSSKYNNHNSFLEAIKSLRELCDQLERDLCHSSYDNLRERFYVALKIQILSSKPYYLDKYLSATYSRGFKAFLFKLDFQRKSNLNLSWHGDDDWDDGNEELDSHETSEREADACPGCRQGLGKCDCKAVYDRFCEANECLTKLNLLDHLVGDIVMKTARLFIERRVTIKGKTNYSHSYLDELTVWVHSVVEKWIIEIHGLTGTNEANAIGQKLDKFLRDAYADVRVSQMFEIILEYPASDAAIKDLKMCLDQSTSSDFRLHLIESVRESLIESLLHPGVNTYDILTAYISAIKALRALDPTGLILQLVTEPVRRYLKSRDDTVRCIVTALTDEEHNSELNREMIKSGSQANENSVDGKGGTIEMNLPNEGEKCTHENFELWKPDPIKLNSSDDVMKSSRFSDIVSILVNIYETKDLFVEEYQKLLSQRLLNKYEECNLDIELRNLELLTMRFSDCELHRCEVMLKDVQTSKRINKRILSGDIRDHKLEGFKNIDVLIVSSPFWPDKFSPTASLSDEPPEIKFPPEIESAMNSYTKAFESIQASRTLHWRHLLGQVNLDLTINGKTQNFVVTPLHASLLYLFKEKKSWKLADLMHKTSLPAAMLRSKLALWQRNGIIRDCGSDKYDLILGQ